jgi:hypothetical protein
MKEKNITIEYIMNSFQTIVLIISIVVLIAILAVIGVTLKNGSLKRKFPPVIGECPDYWENVMDDKDGKNYCLNKKNLGKASCSTKMDFNVYPYTGTNGDCQKKNWSKKCNLTWDGITNVDDICSLDK